MQLEPTQTVAEIVIAHPECARVFHDRRIDFCCHGGVTLAAACGEKALDVERVLGELSLAIDERAGHEGAPPAELSTPALIGHILTRHHEYLRRALPFLRGLADKVASVHGDHEPKLREVRAAFLELADALEPHLDREERSLFPRMLAGEGRDPVVEYELRGMHAEHLEVAKILDRIRAAADDFHPHEWACNSYRTLFADLEHLEGDVMIHVHLENHVLMPRFRASPATAAVQ